LKLFYFRQKKSSAEIDETLKLANINVSEISPLVQTLFSIVPLNEKSNDFKVLELDEHLLKSLQIGDWFVIDNIFMHLFQVDFNFCERYLKQ
jgi:midasin (ATPase involved in ribosome maturation)